MKPIKAIVRMTPGRSGKGMRATFGSQHRATYHKMYYLCAAVKPGSKEAPCQDRVSWIGGNLGGFGILVRRPDLMASALDCGHKHLPGRLTRNVILSCEPRTEEERADAEQLLIKTAPLLAIVLGADRWIAVLHRDTPKPHLHLIIANYDPIKRRRLEFSPKFLSEIQEMTWTPHLVSGKGARMGGHSKRALAIQALKAQDPKSRDRALKAVCDHIEKHKKSDLSQDELALWLASQCALQGWDGSRLLKKDGSPRKKPVIQVDGIDLRFVFLMKFVRRLARSRPKKSKKSPAKKGRLRRITPPDSPSGP